VAKKGRRLFGFTFDFPMEPLDAMALSVWVDIEWSLKYGRTKEEHRALVE
jgi:hypothetical protein